MASQTVNETEINNGFDWSKLLIYIVLITGAVIFIIPFIVTFNISLMNITEAGRGDLFITSPQWGNYVEAWTESNFELYFFNSVKITAIIVIGQVVFCTLAAYAFSHMEFPGRDFIFGLFLATLTLPAAIVWVPNFLTISWLGKVTPIQWMNNWPALTIPFMSTAFGIFLLRQFFLQMPRELWDSAQIDGAGHLRYLTQIVLPLSKAPIMVLVLFGVISTWDQLAWPILVTRDDTWRPIAYGLQVFLDEEQNKIHLQMAGAIITMAPLLIVYFFAQKQFIEGMTRSGLKG